MKKIMNLNVLFTQKNTCKFMLVMKLTFLFTIILTLTASANSYSQNTKLSLSKEDATIHEILSAIEQNSEFIFLYESGIIDQDSRFTIDVSNTSIKKVLDQLFENTDIKYKIDDRQIGLYKKSSNISRLPAYVISEQQPATKIITGKVTDKNDVAIPGVSIVVKGTTLGTISDLEGKYSLKVPVDAETIVFSFIGMRSIEMPFEGNIINATMEEDILGLDEVMVVAYGTVKKSSFTGSAGVVGSEKLGKRTVTSVTQALEGSTTGVQVTSSGQPGTSPGIRIRGFGSLNGNSDPLYIVDGAQFEGSMSLIDPNDIESMTILKDASSTALYGSRAANGIVLITTKKGREGREDLKISVNALGGIVTQAIPYYETVGPKPYYELMGEAYKNALIHSEGYTPGDALAEASTGIFSQLNYNPFNVPNDQILGADGKINPSAEVIAKSLDWYAPLEQTGYRQNYNISASGSGKQHTYYVSLGYLDERGYVVDSDYERMNARVNIDFSPKKWLNFGTNFYGTITEMGAASGTTGNSSYGNPFFFARQMGSIYPVYIIDPTTGEYILDANGEKQYDLGGGYSEYGINARPSAATPGRQIVAELDYNFNQTNTNNISSRTYAELLLFDGLKARIDYSIDIQNFKSQEFENEIVGDGAPSGRYNQERSVRSTTNFLQSLSYNKTFNKKHNLSILVAHESFDREYSEVYGMKSQLIVQGINEFDNFVTPTNQSGYTSNKKTEGYLSRLNYNYLDKYYLSASFRRDGTSVFHKDARWGNFYSVGASWRLDQEAFIENIPWIDQLKLRSSYGEVGNDRLGSFYVYQALYGTLPNASAPGLGWESIGNSELQWESINSFDVAVEFGLFDRISGSVEFYKRTTEDMLYDMPLPPSMGLNSQPRNIATMYNQGIEVGLDAVLIKNSDFKWELGLQASTIKNEITEIPDPFVSGSKRWDIGHSRYDFYLYDFYGVDSETGDIQYHVWEEDENGNTAPQYNEDGTPVLTNKYTSTEKGYIGASSIPDLYGSVTNSLNYKGFQLDILCTYSIGGKVLDYNYRNLMGEGDYGNALHVDLINAWRNPGDITDIPRMEHGNQHIAATSDRWLTDASFLTIKNVNLSYTFNNNLSNSLGLNSLKVFVTGENLHMWSARKGMDPQEGFDGTTSNVYLPQRIFSLGVNVSL